MAGYVTFRSTGLRDMISYFQELQRTPVKLVTALNAEARATYADTQAATHILTGSLKASGRLASEYHNHTWRATITYGGPSTGPNNPVRYAIFEMQRGGIHDFLAPTRAHEPRFEAILRQGMPG